MSARSRRGSAPYEFALNLTLFTCVAAIGWVSPSAFHDALIGAADVVVAHTSTPIDVVFGVPPMLAKPGVVVPPLAAAWSAAEAARAACASAVSADPWVADACAKPDGEADPVDAKPWASTPWGAE